MAETFPIIPLDDRVIISRVKGKEKTQGGIYIPESGKEKPVFGKIISRGPNVKDSNLQIGAIVLYGKYSGTEINVLGVEYLLMREEEIQGIIADRELAESFVEEGA